MSYTSPIRSYPTHLLHIFLTAHLTSAHRNQEKMMRQVTKQLLSASRGTSGRSLSTLSNEISKMDLFNPTEEHSQLRKMLRTFVETEVDPQALEFNRNEKFNIPLFRKLGDIGILGITAGVEYGGSGMDAVAAVIAHEELSASDPAFCLSFLAHSMLFVNNVNQNASHEQKLKFLPGACDGSLICGMGMSEPGAGTDVLGMSTTAVKSADGSYFTLNGTKMWITNGTIDGTDTGDAFLLYAKTGTGRSPNDLSAFLIEKGMPGFTLGSKIQDKCGMRASNTAELVLSDVKVPVANLVGKIGGAGLCMMRNLEIERIVLAAMSLGIARRSIEVMTRLVVSCILFSLTPFSSYQLFSGAQGVWQKHWRLWPKPKGNC